MDVDLVTHARLAWNKIEQERVDEGALQSIELNTYHSDRKLRVAVDSHGFRHLLIPIRDGTPVGVDDRSIGVRVSSRTLEEGGRLLRFVDVSCLKPQLNEVFMRIIMEIASILSDGVNAFRASTEVLDRFRELLRVQSGIGLSEEKIIGLIGELLVLKELLQVNSSSHSTWRGPSGARHDFQSATLAVEAKASRSRSGRIFQISSLDQLEPPPGGELFLATVRLENAPFGEISLPTLVEEVRELSSTWTDVVDLLAEAGYRVDEADQYADLRYRIIERRLYEVLPDFPSLVPSKMKDGHIPSGVLEATYNIDLTNEPPIPVDDAAAARVWERMAGATE